MYKDKETADVYFTFEGSPKQIAAHKCILALEYTKFENQLYSLDQSNTIHIKDSTAEEFDIFLMSFYTKDFDKHLTHKNIEGILMLIKKYKPLSIQSFQSCENYLIRTKNDDNFFWIYELSRKHSLQSLSSNCAVMLIAETDKLLSSNAFSDVSYGTLKKILHLKFHYRDVPTVCDAGLNWAEMSCERNNMEKSNENLRKALGDAFDLLPFAELHPMKFISIQRKYGNMFSAEEVKQIIDAIASKSF